MDNPFPGGLNYNKPQTYVDAGAMGGFDGVNFRIKQYFPWQVANLLFSVDSDFKNRDWDSCIDTIDLILSNISFSDDMFEHESLMARAGFDLDLRTQEDRADVEAAKRAYILKMKKEIIGILTRNQQAPGRYARGNIMHIVNHARKKVYDKSGNMIIGITGKANRGKSHTGCQIAINFHYGIRLSECLVYDISALVEKTLAYLHLTPHQFEDMGEDGLHEWLEQNVDSIKISPGNVIIFDEAGMGAFVRDFFSADNKSLSKILQIWRFLRMLVIFIVPESLGLAEKNIKMFLDLEIEMGEISDANNDAVCVAWEYLGRNRFGDPIKKRIPGCQDGGFIHVHPLPVDVVAEYERIAKVHKIGGLIRQIRTPKGSQPGRKNMAAENAKSLKNMVKKARTEPEKYQSFSKRGQKYVWDPTRFEVHFGVANRIARLAVKMLEEEDRNGISSI